MSKTTEEETEAMELEDSHISLGSENSQDDDEAQPSKRARFDFFSELEKMKEQGAEMKIKDLTPGQVWNQELTLKISWIDRSPNKFLAFHGYDGENYIVLKAFGNQMEKYMQALQAFKTYSFSNFIVSKIDPQYKNRNPFDAEIEIYLNKDSEYRVAAGDMNICIPESPISISAINDLPNDSIVDFKGLVVRMGNISQTKNGKSMKEVNLIEPTSKETMTIVFWNRDALNFKCEMPCPIAFRNVIKKSENLLWVNNKSTFEISDDVDPENKLRNWYDNLLKQ